MQNLRKRVLTGAAGLLASGMIVCAQDPAGGDRLFVRKLADEAGVTMMQGVTTATIAGGVQYVASEMSFDGKVVKGVPYSGQAVTETTQTLADGNRIHRTVTASVYRDSEGRTRREQTLAAIGPLGPPGDAPQTVFINDPVANTRFLLEPAHKIARQMPAPPSPDQMKVQMEKMIARQKIGGDSVSTDEAHTGKFFAEMKVGAAGGAGFAMADPVLSAAPPQVKTESLGTQVIEGVQAEGTRTTMTIAAGQIGNDRPIDMVSERWYSADLQTVVMTRHTDPRMGETVYKLTNISRSEPSLTLFQVPADYTTMAAPEKGQMLFLQKPGETK